VTGRIQTRTYEAKDGTKRYVTEVVAEEVDFLNDKKKNNSGVTTGSTGSFGSDYSDDITPIDDGSIPF
ncbi:single-stranded DNA-binding protein, partial [Arthrospira platensis SPKY1]|nr:single-stranded DNA-binding protein [Arthrospira platensis SPKY1]